MEGSLLFTRHPLTLWTNNEVIEDAILQLAKEPLWENEDVGDTVKVPADR